MPKPTLSEIEANWNIHLAGITAEKEAREQGVSPAVAETLLDAAVGGKRVGHMIFPPIHAGFMLMLNRVQKLSQTHPELGTEIGNLAALALILHSPDVAWSLLKNKADDVFVDAVTEFARLFTLAQLKELMSWVTEEMARLGDGNEGKSAAE